METILVLAHTENDGSLAKPVREALHAAATLHKSCLLYTSDAADE